MKKTRTKNAIMAATMAALLLVGGVFAYLTDTDNQTNTFTMGDIGIDLTEPTWDEYPDENGNDIPDIAEDIWAGKEIDKDPTITNTGDNDAYVYLQVTVPKASVIVAAEDGTVTSNTPAVTQLFTYTVNSGWTLLKSNTEGATENVYLYAYVGLVLECAYGKDVWNGFEGKLCRTEKGNWLIIYTIANELKCMVVSKRKAKKLLKQYDYEAYVKLYGELEEA